MIFGSIVRFVLAFWAVSVLGLLLAVACSAVGYRFASRRARRSRPEQIGSRSQRRATAAAFKQIARTVAAPAAQDRSAQLAQLAELVRDEGSEV